MQLVCLWLALAGSTKYLSYGSEFLWSYSMAMSTESTESMADLGDLMTMVAANCARKGVIKVVLYKATEPRSKRSTASSWITSKQAWVRGDGSISIQAALLAAGKTERGGISRTHGKSLVLLCFGFLAHIESCKLYSLNDTLGSRFWTVVG